MALDSHRSVGPTVTCACERSSLHTSHENLTHDDLMELMWWCFTGADVVTLHWSWCGDASLESSYKYRLSPSERFDCTEITINYLFAGSYQNLISEWHVTIKMHLVAGFESESDTYFTPHVACLWFYLPLTSVPLSVTAHLCPSQFC